MESASQTMSSHTPGSQPSVEMTRPSRDVVLQGRYVTLQWLEPSLLQALWSEVNACQTDPFWQYLPEGPYSTFAAFKDAVEARFNDVDGSIYATVDNTTGNPYGWASHINLDLDERAAETGIVVLPAHHKRTPRTTEVIYLIMCHAFDDLGYRRLEWQCDVANAPSRRTAERFGFTYEQTLKPKCTVNNAREGTAIYSLYADQHWPAARKAMVTWLDPDNFDESGRQRRRLEDIRNRMLKELTHD